MDDSRIIPIYNGVCSESPVMSSGFNVKKDLIKSMQLEISKNIDNSIMGTLNGDFRDEVKELSLREELQQEIDQWL